jgi:opacity protein-like surface antigen
MARKVWRDAGVLASIVAGMGVAGAADLPVKAPVYKATPYVSDWAGFYLGVHGGYGWGSTGYDTPYIEEICGFWDPRITGLGASPKGGLFGGQAGYNWQYGSIVTGLEIDFSGADISAAGSVGTFVSFGGPGTIDRSVKFDELATARARLGYAVLPNLLAYGTGGLAWGHSEFTGSASSTSFSSAESVDTSNFGWAAGAGLEYKVWDHWLVRGEYLHYDFGKTTYSLPIASINASTTIDVVRGGLSYKF